MMKSITQALLTSAMSLTWKLIRAGERAVAFSESYERHEGLDEHAGLVELTFLRAGRAIVGAGERLEFQVNALAMRLGYNDGEVAGIVAWPSLAI